MTNSRPVARSPADLLADATWLPHRLYAGAGAIRMVEAPRSVHRGATFLDDEGLRGCATSDLPLARLQGLANGPAPAFIFHSAFCCSTLLARAFDLPGSAMGLKEPAILNDLAAVLRGGGRIDAILPPILSLLARPFAPAERVVVKPSNVANALIDPILRAAPDSRSVLMYAPLRGFLVSVAKKGMWGRIWMRKLYAVLKVAPSFDPGIDDAALLTLTDLQIAALAWLQQQRHFADLLAVFGGRLRSLPSETLLHAREQAVVAAARHLGVAGVSGELLAHLAPDLFAEHSKRLGERYDPATRAAEQRETAGAHGEEIAMVARWAEVVAGQFSVPLTLSHPLLP